MTEKQLEEAIRSRFNLELEMESERLANEIIKERNIVLLKESILVALIVAIVAQLVL